MLALPPAARTGRVGVAHGRVAQDDRAQLVDVALGGGGVDAAGVRGHDGSSGAGGGAWLSGAPAGSGRWAGRDRGWAVRAVRPQHAKRPASLDRFAEGRTRDLGYAEGGAHRHRPGRVACHERAVVRSPVVGRAAEAGGRTPSPHRRRRRRRAVREGALADARPRRRSPSSTRASSRRCASSGAVVEEFDPVDGLPDAVFAYDPAFVIPSGTVEFQSAKAARVGEGAHLVADLESVGVPTVGRLVGDATADAGDMFWLDDDTVAIGRSYRTNEAAVDQMRGILAGDGVARRGLRPAARHGAGVLPAPDVGHLADPRRPRGGLREARAGRDAALAGAPRHRVGRRSTTRSTSPSAATSSPCRPGVVVMGGRNVRTADKLRERGRRGAHLRLARVRQGRGRPHLHDAPDPPWLARPWGAGRRGRRRPARHRAARR